MQSDKEEARDRSLNAAQAHEDERQEIRDRNDALSNQLGDIASSLSQHNAECTEKRDIQEARWEDKQARRESKQRQWEEMQQQLADLLREKKECKERMDDKAKELESSMEGLFLRSIF